MLERATYRFNELQQQLQDLGLSISTPTITRHLGHLVEKGLVIRDEIEKQYVTYRFNWEKWPNLDQLLKERIFAEKRIQQELDSFRNRPILEQILYVHDLAVLMFFFSLRNSIISKLKPEMEFEANMNALHVGHVFGRAEQMILDTMEERGEEYTQECLQSIDRLTSQYKEARAELGLLQKLPIPMVQTTADSVALLKKINAHLNKNRKPEERKLQPDIIHLALEEYGKKLGII